MKWPMIYPRGAAHTFYLRLGIPRRLQALYGHKEVLRSLRTSSLDETKVRALASEADLRAALARLERPATPLDPEAVAALYQQKVLTDDVTDRIQLAVSPNAPEGDEAESMALTMRFESLDDDPSQIHKLLDQVLFEHIKTPLPASWHFGAGQVVFLAMTEECSR